MSLRHGDAHAGLELLDAHGDLEERATERFERGLVPERVAWSGLAKLVQQPIRAGVQEDPELVA